MYRKGNYIAGRIFAMIIVVIFACVVAVQTPYVQTRLTQYALDRLTEKLDGHVQYSELSIMTSGVLVLRDATIIDDNPYPIDNAHGLTKQVDTLFHAGTITATFSIASLFHGKGLHLNRVTVMDATMHLTIEPNEWKTNLNRIFRLHPKGIRREPGPDIFDIRKFTVRNFRYRQSNLKPGTKERDKNCIDFNDLDVRANVRGHGMKFTGSRMYAVADHGSLREKSGYVVTDLSGRVAVGQGKTLIENLKLDDNWSRIRANSFSMSYEKHWKHCKFTEDIVLELKLKPTTLGIQTISTFAGGALGGNRSVFELESGKIRGYVNDFSIKNFKFRDLASGVGGELECSIIGLPDTRKMLIDAQIGELHFTTDSLTKLLAQWMPSLPDLSGYAPGVNFAVSAQASGPMDRLNFMAELAADNGWIRTVGDVRNIVSSQRGIELNARMRSNALNLSEILGNIPIGECDLYARASAKFGDDMQIKLDSLNINRLQFKELSGEDSAWQEYRDVIMRGSYMDKTFVAHVEASDPKLQLELDALADLRDHEGLRRYRLAGEIGCLDLSALGIDRREGGARLSTDQINGDIRVRGHVIEGEADVRGIAMHNGHGTTDLGNIDFDATASNGEQHFSLVTDFADLNLDGTGTIADFISDIQDVTIHRHLSALSAKSAESDLESAKYRLDLKFHDSRGLLRYLAPGLYIADSTRLAMIVSESGQMNGRLYSSRLAYGKNYIRKTDLHFDNWSGSLNASIQGSELRLGGVNVESPRIKASAADNKFEVLLDVDSFAGGGSKSELLVNGEVTRDSLGILNISARPDNSYISTTDAVWHFSESEVLYDGYGIKLDGFRINNGEQFICLDGGYSARHRDTLSLHAEKLDLSLINGFLNRDFDFRGDAAGRVYLISDPGLRNAVFVDFRLDSLGIGKEDAGNLRLLSVPGEQRNDLRLLVNHEIEGRNSVRATGHYYLDNGRLDLTASLDRFPLKVLNPFLDGLFKGMDGGISGKLMLQSAAGEIETSSEDLYINDAMLTLALTGVSYTIQGPLSMDNTGLYLNEVSISDGDNGFASVNGAVKYNKLNDLNLNVRAMLNNLKLLDSGREGNPGFYGQLRADGSASVTGPLKALNISAAVNTNGPGNIYIPASGSTANSNNLLTFTEPQKVVDPYEQMLETLDSSRDSGSDINIQLLVNVSPTVNANIELDRYAGTSVSFNGSGSATIHISPSKDIFDINGDYSISEGNFKFSIPGLLERDFSIEESSSVRFNGDILESELDITATYKLKTSLSTLISDTLSVNTRRTVECGIQISDRLRNPRINFSIDVPDLDPTTKAQVESALNTDDKVQKQFMALLLMSSFIPDESSGVVNSSNILYSNVTELMSNQLNTILQKLDIPLNVGIGYQSSNSGGDIFDVAISTQLFNNRVIVGGSLGNRQYSSSGSSDVVGDLDIEIKLDPEGKFRLNIFSHSADEYSNYLDYSQRNGVGISYQKSYSGIREFFRKVFVRKKKRVDEELEISVKKIIVEYDDQGQIVSHPDSTRRKRSRDRASR